MAFEMEFELVRFYYRCPAGHGAELAWFPRELSYLIEHGELQFYCHACATARPPTSEEIAAVTRAAAKWVPAPA
jgi:hypothetical protein